MKRTGARPRPSCRRRGRRALLELGGSRPRFALAPEPRLSLERTDTGMTRSDSMTETSELLTSWAHARVPPPPRAGRHRRRASIVLAARSQTARLGRRLFAGGAQAAHRAVPREAQAKSTSGGRSPVPASGVQQELRRHPPPRQRSLCQEGGRGAAQGARRPRLNRA